MTIRELCNMSVIDAEGFRANVCIILSNQVKQVFWARRANHGGWQFPQGGIKVGESPEVAMFRELREEVGLLPEQVKIVDRTDNWLSYRLPEEFIQRNVKPLCLGQKQIWYLMELIADEENINLTYSAKPEFDHWEWTDYWSTADKVVAFKRKVYQQALEELASSLFA